MGIVPITGFIPISNSNSVKNDLDPMPMERAEPSSRAGDDEKYSPSSKSEEDAEDDAGEDEVVEVASDETMDDLFLEGVGQSEEIEDPATTLQPASVNLFA